MAGKDTSKKSKDTDKKPTRRSARISNMRDTRPNASALDQLAAERAAKTARAKARKEPKAKSDGKESEAKSDSPAAPAHPIKLTGKYARFNRDNPDVDVQPTNPAKRKRAADEADAEDQQGKPKRTKRAIPAKKVTPKAAPNAARKVDSDENSLEEGEIREEKPKKTKRASPTKAASKAALKVDSDGDSLEEGEIREERTKPESPKEGRTPSNRALASGVTGLSAENSAYLSGRWAEPQSSRNLKRKRDPSSEPNQGGREEEDVEDTEARVRKDRASRRARQSAQVSRTISPTLPKASEAYPQASLAEENEDNATGAAASNSAANSPVDSSASSPLTPEFRTDTFTQQATERGMRRRYSSVSPRTVVGKEASVCPIEHSSQPCSTPSTPRTMIKDEPITPPAGLGQSEGHVNRGREPTPVTPQTIIKKEEPVTPPAGLAQSEGHGNRGRESNPVTPEAIIKKEEPVTPPVGLAQSEGHGDGSRKSTPRSIAIKDEPVTPPAGIHQPEEPANPPAHFSSPKPAADAHRSRSPTPETSQHPVDGLEDYEYYENKEAQDSAVGYGGSIAVLQVLCGPDYYGLSQPNSALGGGGYAGRDGTWRKYRELVPKAPWRRHSEHVPSSASRGSSRQW